MGTLIDPYMFDLSDEEEIKNNISFFEKIINLCNEKRLSILLYKDMISRISNREIQPFPIKLENISDKDLKETIIQLNRSFSYALLRMFESIDIAECTGNQEFKIYDGNEIEKDDNYFEMFVTLLLPCYLKTVEIEDIILTGNKKSGKQIGDRFRIECDCSQGSYTKNCIFSGIEELTSEKEKILDLLREKKTNGEICITSSIPAELGNHHDHVQAKSFSTLNDLTFKNKRVLKLFREVGLKKIIFGRFLAQGGKLTGSIKIYDIEQKDTQDIIKAKFIAETGFEIVTDLYFPKDIGMLLFKYFQKERITYQNMSELLEKF